MAEVLTTELQLRLGQLLLADKLIKISEDEAVYHQIEVADGVADFSVDFGGVGTSDVVYVESDQNISFRLVAAGTSIAVDANGFALIWGTAPTAILLSNASGATANVKVLIAGT